MGGCQACSIEGTPGTLGRDSTQNYKVQCENVWENL